MQKSDLLRAASAARSATEPRGTLPVLACLLVERRDDRLVLTGTDLHSSRTVQVASDLALDRCVVNAAALCERLGGLPDGELRVQQTGTRLTLSVGKRSFQIVTNLIGEFPAVKRVADRNPVMVDGPILADMLKRTLFAASDDFTREHLNAVRIELRPGVIRAIATDGHRLALCERECKHELRDDLLIPKRGAALLLQLAASAERVALKWDDSYVELTAGLDSLTVKRSGAQFPPYEQVMPRFPKAYTVPRAEWLDSVASMSGIQDATKSSRVHLQFGQDTLALTASGDGQGGTDEVTCTTWDEQPARTIASSSRYLADALKAADGDNVDVHAAGELDPLLLVAGGTKLIVMPMRA